MLVYHIDREMSILFRYFVKKALQNAEIHALNMEFSQKLPNPLYFLIILCYNNMNLCAYNAERHQYEVSYL